MNLLKDKVVEIAKHILESEDKTISRSDFKAILGGDLEPFNELVQRALLHLPKLVKRQGRLGGFQYSEERYSRGTLTQTDSKTLASKVDELYKEYKASLGQEKRAKPEKAVEDAFKVWIHKQERILPAKTMIRFRSSGRRGGRWQNVDGYHIEFRTLKYQFSVRPILTTFEVKAALPDIVGISQAKSYRSFSHRVYLVFKHSEGREATLNKLRAAGFKDEDSIGVFYTTDGVNFEMLMDSNVKEPSPEAIDEILDIILEDVDKEQVMAILYDYFYRNMFLPSIQD